MIPGTPRNKPDIGGRAASGGFLGTARDYFEEARTTGIYQKGLALLGTMDALPRALFPASDDRKLSRDQALERMKPLGVDFHVPEDGIELSTFELLAQRDLDRNEREFRRARIPEDQRSFWGSIAGGLAGTMADPAQLLLSALPWTRALGMGAPEASLALTPGLLSRAAVRSQFAVVDSFLGATTDEILNQAIISDYGLSESDVEDPLANIALGTVAGTVFQLGIGTLGDVLSPGELRAVRNRVEAQALTGAPIETEAFVRGIAAFADKPEVIDALKSGGPMPDVERIINPFDMAKTQKKGRKLRRALTRDRLGGGESWIITADGERKILSVADDALELEGGERVLYTHVFRDPTTRIRTTFSKKALEETRRALQAQDVAKTATSDLDPEAPFNELDRPGKPLPADKLEEAVELDIAESAEAVEALVQQFEADPETGLSEIYSRDTVTAYADSLKRELEHLDKAREVFLRAADCAGKRMSF